MAVPPDRKNIIARWFDKDRQRAALTVAQQGEITETVAETTTVMPTPKPEGGVTRYQGPIPFIQRMTFETDLLTDLAHIGQGYTQFGYQYRYNLVAYWWLYENVKAFTAKVSSQNMAPPTLLERWDSQEPTVLWQDRPLKMLEMALDEANRLGLTLRKTAPPFRPLPRDQMLSMLDPSRKIENPEEIGVLNVARIIAKSAHRRRDCFMVLDVSNRIPQFGAGKSQLMIQVLAEANAQLDRTFDVRTDVVYGADHSRFRRLLNDRTPFQAFGVDELDQFAYAREAMRGENKETMQTLKRTRKWARPILGCSGSIWGLDPFLRDVKITHRIRIEEWDDDHFEGRATLWEKGGFTSPPDDLWGRVPPVFSFRFNGLSKLAFENYSACVEKAEEINLDKFLQKNPRWLLETPESGPES